MREPWGIVHGGVYCSIVESLASVSGQTWLSENGGGTVHHVVWDADLSEQARRHLTTLGLIDSVRFAVGEAQLSRRDDLHLFRIGHASSLDRAQSKACSIDGRLFQYGLGGW